LCRVVERMEMLAFCARRRSEIDPGAWCLVGGATTCLRLVGETDQLVVRDTTQHVWKVMWL
jgi:hypothetical protein